MANEFSVARPNPNGEFPSVFPLGNTVIPIVNKLHGIFAHIGSQFSIELPHIAVVGSESSDKSSVVEALVGRDFLPRGSEICTRRPLIIQLLQSNRNADDHDEEYGEFLHLPDKRFYDFSEIRREIQREREREMEAEGNKGVTEKSIGLKIYSPNILNVTLVDLPSITKVPVGDEPSDIEAKIRTMIMSYIETPGCLILAVPATLSNLENSDALQIAKKADPDGFRTITVITKDIRKNQSINAALEADGKFLRGHRVYNDLAYCCGIPDLPEKLNEIIVQHIKAVLLGLKSHMRSALIPVSNEYASYGEITESKHACTTIILDSVRLQVCPHLSLPLASMERASKRQRLDNHDSAAEVMRKMKNKRCPRNPLEPHMEEQYARLWLKIGRLEEELASDDEDYDDVSDDVCLNSENKKTFSGPIVVAKGEEKRPRDEEGFFIDMEEFFIEREKDGGPILEAEACCELNNYRLCDILDYY